MTVLDLAFWIMLMLLGFAGSALYSGLETGAYSLNRIRLQIYAHEHSGPALSLKKLVQDSTGLLSTLLIGNNLANYLGTASLAVILQSYGLPEWQNILLNTFIVTPILFVFGETLPKDLFAAHADRLMYRLSWSLVISKRLFTFLGLVPLIQAFTWVIMRFVGNSTNLNTLHPRRQVETLVQEGVGYGLLTADQSAIVQRVLSLSERTVRQDMTPWARAQTVRVDDSPRRLWELAEQSSHSRLPVLGKEHRVVGVVNLMDALVHERDQTPAIREMMDTPLLLNAKTSTREALEQMRREHLHLAIILNDRKIPIGIVSLKDLIEPITGQLASW